MGASSRPNPYETGYTNINYDSSFVFIKAIENLIENEYCNKSPNPPCSPAPYLTEKGNHIRSTTAHELAHQFGVNPNCGGGHCSNNAWCGGAGGRCRSWCKGDSDEWCMMKVQTPTLMDLLCQRCDNVYRMDCNDLSANSGCPEADCSGANRISLRTNEDPQ